jgi:hypothetical protein
LVAKEAGRSRRVAPVPVATFGSPIATAPSPLALCFSPIATAEPAPVTVDWSPIATEPGPEAELTDELLPIAVEAFAAALVCRPNAVD